MVCDVDYWQVDQKEDGYGLSATHHCQRKNVKIPFELMPKKGILTAAKVRNAASYYAREGATNSGPLIK